MCLCPGRAERGSPSSGLPGTGLGHAGRSRTSRPAQATSAASGTPAEFHAAGTRTGDVHGSRRRGPCSWWAPRAGSGPTLRTRGCPRVARSDGSQRSEADCGGTCPQEKQDFGDAERTNETETRTMGLVNESTGPAITEGRGEGRTKGRSSSLPTGWQHRPKIDPARWGWMSVPAAPSLLRCAHKTPGTNPRRRGSPRCPVSPGERWLRAGAPGALWGTAEFSRSTLELGIILTTSAPVNSRWRGPSPSRQDRDGYFHPLP